ncbi:PAS domain S-box protein [Allohahella marinimesophila]|uniref:histidine kinase n=1 Tax=Allohahella marinimesophila TaxID=1054972 RepID=A0ABP7NJG1_9GAMM
MDKIPASKSTLYSDPTEAERLKTFVASVTDYAIYMLTPEGIVNSWNAGAVRFKGYTADEIIGKHFSCFYTSEDKARGIPAKALQTAVDTGRFEDEGWRIRKDGTRFWASVVLDAIRDDAGLLLGFTKITRDLTDRKKAADALHASEERFRLLVQGVTDYAIYMLSPEGQITNWNMGARRIKGYDESEVVGSHFSRFYTDEDRLRKLPQKALETARVEGRFESEGWRIRKDGSRFWAHVVIDPVSNDKGELIGFAKITRDITERRESALALEKAQNALFQSQKLEAIGKLTGGVAHDFNNLLSVITNGMALLRMNGVDQQNLSIVESIERAVTRGATLTRELLTFARQQPLKQERNNINAIIRSFEAVLRRANTGAVSLNLDLGGHLPDVMIDAAQFEAALLNLIVNAQDATPDGGTIDVRTRVVALDVNDVGTLPAGRYVAITVSDTGVGMSPDVVSRATEPFFTTKEIGKGTGLGLSQVYGFIQQSRGDINIDSALGKGARISIYLPALDDAIAAVVNKDKDRESVLVVDDEPDVLAMAQQLFQNFGYEVFTARSGEEALDILQRTTNIDLLFTDLVMPAMNGLELGVKARAMIPGLKIVIASGYTGLADLGASDISLEDFQFVSKPYQISEIIKNLRLVD